MRIVITGGHGFLGNAVARELLQRGSFDGRPIDQLVLADRMAPDPDPFADDERVTTVVGDLTDTIDELFAEPVDVLFHLAAAVSGESERDFDLGMHANVDVTRAVLTACRAQQQAGGPLVRLFFASSLAVYGSDDALPLAATIDETQLPMPQGSYGAQKAICEYLVNDHTRKGFLDGRVARLMTVCVRPGRPNAAASSFVSGIIREPLAGEQAICPVEPELPVLLASPRRTVEGILTLAEATRGDGPGELTGRLPVNLPGLRVTVGEMVAALRRIAGDEVADRVVVQPDDTIRALVLTWPRDADNSRAATLGLEPDPDIDTVIEQYIADHPEAIAGSDDEAR
ncbi:NAD-dependent epimerase [Enemella evansiae]|uniref:D-erythronate dehydrogenase n=1 Tax=Enemella evansiae TaxID=2016499 RepID=UPI000B9631C0|nr:D-erythronate dehydrogenase [Enemella evansiae]OYN96769.1 NAD-dependent epimerase [Enemella evansiae]